MENNYDVNYITVPKSIGWDEYFMLQAMMASFKSKDPATKVGCVIVDGKNHQVTMGYNGMVAGIDESQLPWGKDKSVPIEHQKHGYVVHAEANAILHANRPLEGCRLYVTLFPCNQCAKLVASKKIAEVIFLSDKHSNKDITRMSKRLFDLAGIKYRQMAVSEELIGKMSSHFHNLMTQV